MAGEAELPQWLTIVGGLAGVIITTIVVRLGWNKTAEAIAPEQGRIMGAIVDSGAVRELTLAIQSQTEVLRTASDETGKELRNVADELRNHGDEVRRLGNKIEDRS